MLEPKISIVTICKNAQHSIERTLTSVVSQTYANIEYIIVDGASTDRTLELIYNYREQITKIISEPDDGIYDGMNKGVRAASGDYIVFINAGDYLIEANVIKSVVQTIQSKALQNIDILYANLLVYDPVRGQGSIWAASKRTRLSMYMGSLPHPSTFFSRTAFEKNGLYDTSFKIAGDYEWFVRAFEKNKLSFTHLDVLTAVFINDGVSTHQKWQSLQDEEKERFRQYYYSKADRFWLNMGVFLRKNKVL